LLKIESTDTNVFALSHPDDDLLFRKHCLLVLKRIGYAVGTGLIVGLPGQTLDALAKDLAFLVEFDADMISVSPFVPHPSTPWRDEPKGSPHLVLKCMAIARLLVPSALIPATTALETWGTDMFRQAFMVGANVLMRDITPYHFRQYYEIYPKFASKKDFHREEIDKLQCMLKTCDKRLAFEVGHRERKDYV